MLQLDKLVRLVKKRKRVGRGGSRGGTSGRGHKGQKARSGCSIDVGFEGGQMPLYRRLPKRGFKNARFKTLVFEVGLTRINESFEDGQTVTREALIEKNIIKCPRSKSKGVVKVLCNGTITKKLTLSIDRCSKAAVEAIEKAGGTVVYTKEM